MRFSIVAFALLALTSVACAAPPEEDGGEGAGAMVGLPSEAWTQYAAQAIAQAEKDYAAAERGQITPAELSYLPVDVLSRYSREGYELKAFFMRDKPGAEMSKYALLQVTSLLGAPTRLVFVNRESGPYKNREIGVCIAASGKPLSKCTPAR
jgi:hypothetical protein